MNENLNLVEILKDCPKGTKLYSTVYGDVEFYKIDLDSDSTLKIYVKIWAGVIVRFDDSGKLELSCRGECTLFPSRDQRDWSKFQPKKPKFEPKTLEAFDRVLTRDASSAIWRCQLFSHIIKNEGNYPYLCISDTYKYCIPYNEETKHLVGTTEEAPEYYRYWED